MGTVGAIVLPLFNIPLIVRIWQRKSSKDFSMTWAVGVWVCIVLMTPQALRSPDDSFKIYGYLNIVFFSIVAFMVVRYRDRQKQASGGKDG